MTLKIINILKLFGFALVGGLCSFFLSSVYSLFIPMTASTGMVVSIGVTILALICLIMSLFLKRSYRFPIFVFFLGFVLISRFLEGLFVYFYNILP